MSGDFHAYRASAAVLKAFEEHVEARRRFVEEIVEPFKQAHPDNLPVWQGNNFSRFCVGFSDDTAEVPAGLSRNSKRGYLIPRRGAAGDSWRGMMEALNRFPSLREALRPFGIETEVLDIDRSRLCTPGMRMLGGQLYFTCAVPLSSPELTEVKLSEYFAEVEKQETADARAEAEAMQGQGSDA